MNRSSLVITGLIGIALAGSFFGHASSPYSLKTLKGETLRIEIRAAVNENQQRETTYSVIEEHSLFSDGKLDVLYGRDLDGDGLGDLWFAVDTSGGLLVLERNSRRPDGWDVAEDLLVNDLEIERRSGARQFFGALYFHLTMSGAARESSLKTLLRMEMNLKELEVRAERIRAQDPRHPSLEQQYQLISAGWRYFGDTVVRKEIREEFLWILADGVTLGMGGVILRGAAAAIKVVTPKLVTEYAEKMYTRYVAAAMERAGEGTARANARLSEDLAAEALATATVRMSMQQRIALQIQALNARSAVARMLAEASAKTLKTLGGALKGGAREWKYIAGTEALQLSAEVFNNREVLFDPNPIILAENIANDKDLLQNMGFMTVETFNAAAVSSQVDSIKGRLAIGAVLSTANSTATSYFVKGETDAQRMALDTGWEVVVGNSQVQVDFAALKHFEHLAEKSGNRKLKLLGWVAVGVNQFVGYVAYSATTRTYERSKVKKETEEKPPVRFVPVLAPT